MTTVVEKESGHGGLYFMVGALIVIVAGIGYFVATGGADDGADLTINAPAIEAPAIAGGE